MSPSSPGAGQQRADQIGAAVGQRHRRHAAVQHPQGGLDIGVGIQLPEGCEDGVDRHVVDLVRVKRPQGLPSQVAERPVLAHRGQSEPVAQHPGEPERHHRRVQADGRERRA
jgi:hypothetical protein